MKGLPVFNGKPFSFDAYGKARAKGQPRSEERRMAARAYWSGHLKISLVSFGIELFSATKSRATISFHQIDRKTGQRVRHLNVIDDDKPVDRSEIIKGYEYSKGEYVTLEPDEIAKLRIPTKKVIDIARFVDLEELDPALFESPFFVLPQPKESSDAFAVVRKALQQTKKAAIGEIAFGGREHLVAVAVSKDDSFKGLMAYTLRYGDELREGKDYMPAGGNVDVDKKQLAMASELIRAYSAPLQLDEFKDDYEAALRELIEAKEKNTPLPVEEKQPRRAKVTDLMDALRRSVTEAKRPPARQKTAPAARGNKGPVLVKAIARKHKAA
jgi:DNA end-binding protein Ku